MARNSRRSPCPVACTLDLLGDRWTLLVVRDLLIGRTTFKEFLASPEGIATNMLTERLRRLEAAGLVERHPDPSHAGRSRYALTERGRSLEPLLSTIRDWGLENLKGTEVRL
ncbi:MAG: helix-turn-helix domain-containing protein [Planctomycetota bacterium]